MSTSGTLFLVVGPSGVGKDSLIRAARPRLLPHGFSFPRRWITALEDRGEDHIPVSRTDFDEAVARGLIVINWTAHGLCYGIPAAAQDDLSAGLHVIVNASRAVLDEARARFSPVRILHVTAPMRVVQQRLSHRARESATEVETRLKRAVAVVPEGNDVIPFSNELPLIESAGRFADAILAATCS